MNRKLILISEYYRIIDFSMVIIERVLTVVLKVTDH